MKKRWYQKAPKFIFFGLLVATAFTGAVMLLWNAILPGVLHVGAITFWQALGILALCKILFGGRRGFGGGGWQKRRMWNKWQNMTPEEQEQMKSRMRGCGRGRGWWENKDRTDEATATA